MSIPTSSSAAMQTAVPPTQAAEATRPSLAGPQGGTAPRRPSWFSRFTSGWSSSSTPTVNKVGASSGKSSLNSSPSGSLADIDEDAEFAGNVASASSAASSRAPKQNPMRSANVGIMGRGGQSYGTTMVGQHGGLKGGAGPSASAIYGGDLDGEREDADAEMNGDQDGDKDNCQWGYGMGAIGSFLT